MRSHTGQFRFSAKMANVFFEMAISIRKEFHHVDMFSSLPSECEKLNPLQIGWKIAFILCCAFMHCQNMEAH